MSDQQQLPPLGCVDAHGRTWRDELMAWCVPGPNGEWIAFPMLEDSPPPYARRIPAGGFLPYWRQR